MNRKDLAKRIKLHLDFEVEFIISEDDFREIVRALEGLPEIKTTFETPGNLGVEKVEPTTD